MSWVKITENKLDSLYESSDYDNPFLVRNSNTGEEAEIVLEWEQGHAPNYYLVDKSTGYRYPYGSFDLIQEV